MPARFLQVVEGLCWIWPGMLRISERGITTVEEDGGSEGR